jgi:hypothetical protein
MSTTGLFVELMVIGMGAAGWIGLFVLSFLSYDATILEKLTKSSVAALPALASVYLLGIVIDRLADGLFNALRVEAKRTRYYAAGHQHFHDRNFVLAKGQEFAKQLEYSRSRQRICRGWVVNSVVLALSLNVFLLRHPEVVGTPWKFSAVGTSILLGLAIGCWLSWEKLYGTELYRIKDQAALLRELASQTKPQGA